MNLKFQRRPLIGEMSEATKKAAEMMGPIVSKMPTEKLMVTEENLA